MKKKEKLLKKERNLTKLLVQFSEPSQLRITRCVNSQEFSK